MGLINMFAPLFVVGLESLRDPRLPQEVLKFKVLRSNNIVGPRI